MSKGILIILALICTGLLDAATLTVNLDGSAQYTSIQSAINASANGDIILVYPGRYFENVDYNGKQITVQSLEATTNDTTYISTTIIDGNNTGSCVRFHNAEQNATLRGFTLTHGIGYPIFDDMRRGGGIQIYMNSAVTIMNCVITDNKATVGAGIFMYNGSAVFKGLKIHHNYGIAQGGISIWDDPDYASNIIFDAVNRCSIYDNYGSNPCDIMVMDVMQNLDIYLDMFTVANPDNFYIERFSNFSSSANYTDNLYYQRVAREEINHDLFVSPNGNDSNSGLSADQALKTIAVAVHRIAADSLDRKTVHLLPGTYREGEGLQIFPIPLKSNVNIIGSGSEEVTLYTDIVYDNIEANFIGSWRQRNMRLSGFSIKAAQNSYRLPFSSIVSIANFDLNDLVIDSLTVVENGALLFSNVFNTHITNLVMRNIITQESAFSVREKWVSGSMKNCIFENIHSIQNDPEQSPLAMFDIWVGDSLTVENCKFSNVSVMTTQHTFHISNGNVNNMNAPIHINIKNCLFNNIRSDSPYYAINFENTNVTDFKISNCTFTNNYGQAAAIGLLGNIHFKNNIFNNPDVTYEIRMGLTSPYGYHSTIDFDYNNIRNGQAGISNPYSNNILTYGVNNNSGDPLFASTNPSDPYYLYLTANSPCRDTGTPDTTGLALPISDLAGNYRIWNNRIDMGCYEFDSEPVGNADQNDPEVSCTKMYNYPNPFNPSTTISYSLKEDAKVALDIYNIRGQLVKSLESGFVQKGMHSVVWEGKDNAGNVCASGVYFYRLSTDQSTLTKKMLLLK